MMSPCNAFEKALKKSEFQGNRSTSVLREVFKKLRRENLRPKNATGGGGGGQRCQKDTTVPTKSDFFSNYIEPF